MNIAGLQKLSLLDYPGKMSCIVFTQGCNFRCPFCHNALLVESGGENLSKDSVLEFLSLRKKTLDGVVISGGEPTIQKDLPEFLQEIKSIGYDIKLDTNGSHPDVLKNLVKEKLIDYVAMDIKNGPCEYDIASGTDKFLDKVTLSKEFLLQDTVDYEFRTTLVKGIHTKENLLSLSQWIKGAKRYFLQNYKDSGNILRPFGLGSFDDTQMKEFLELVLPVIAVAKIR